MKFKVNREDLLKPLQQVAGVVERRQTLPVLSNVLLQVEEGRLSITGTDLEVELVGRIPLEDAETGEVTVPARKVMDICRELPDGAVVEMELKDQRLEIRAGRFRSLLSTLPVSDFPSVEPSESDISLGINSKSLKRLIDKTSFAMAHQDVRYFLNGMLIELGQGFIRTVATDGHRLAMSTLELNYEGGNKQVIVPRKGVLELQKLLNEVDEDITISLSSNHLTLQSTNFTFTTKLVDGQFPDYDRVIPKDGSKTILADRLELRQAFSRTAILSNEKYRGIRINLSPGVLQLTANNPEQEEAQETVSVDYEGEPLEVGFNVVYLQDVLGVIEGDKVKLTLHDANSSALLEEVDDDDSLYVVMPMKL